MLKNKATTAIITLILALTIAIPLTTLPIASAQVPLLTRKTIAFIGATPNPIGLGQETLLHIGITDELQNVAHGWEGLTVTVTRPDSTTETLGPFRTDATGGTGAIYIPTMLGTYYLQTHFPQQRYNWTLYGGASILYEASSSEKLALIVQEEELKYWPGVPLPSEYWTRPIDAQLREWHKISANWVASPPNLYAPYNDDAPESAHILWTKQLQMGGIAGGSLGDQAFECGDAYEGFFANSVIIGGNLYYNRFNANGGTRLEQEVVAVNLHTGEELWVRNWNNTRLAFGQVFYWDSYNYHGVFPYLWTTTGSTWNAYDALTGRWVYQLTNVPTGTNIYGSKGEIYRYTVDLANGWITLWNSSRVVSNAGSWIRNNAGTTFNVAWTSARQGGFEWNKTVPKGLPGSVYAYFLEDRIIGSTATTRAVEQMIQRQDGPIVFWAISTKPGQEGQLLYNTTWQPPAGATISFTGASLEDGIFTVAAKEPRTHYGFDINTGKQVWGPSEKQHYLDIYSILFGGRSGMIAYGKHFSLSMSGILYCHDVKTGKLLWTYSYTDPFNEVLWSNDWSIRTAFIADGKIYMGQSEHSPVDPKPRGAPFACVDIETGEEVWSIAGGLRQNDWGGRAIIGDSIMATYDSYDQRIYAVGKGPSAITAVASPDVSVHGSSILVKGAVTDISPGTKDSALTMRFPNGVPAVSDSSMSEWMLYVYKHFPRPTNATGVEVTIDVIDANDNYRNIGTTTSDASGFFSFDWKPDIAGKYTVIATFAGSKSYYPSYTQTAFVVDEAPQNTPTEQSQITLPPFEMYILGTGAAIIIAVAIAAILILKKRP